MVLSNTTHGMLTMCQVLYTLSSHVIFSRTQRDIYHHPFVQMGTDYGDEVQRS